MIEQLTIANNPSVEQPENERKQFDYRPYVINWCLSLRVLDGILVGAKERFVNIKIYIGMQSISENILEHGIQLISSRYFFFIISRDIK